MAETAATTKALTIAQPWATLVAIGAKQIETRSWQTNYRGDIAIHAGKGLVASGGRSGLIELCNTMHFQQALYKGGFITHGHCDFDALPTAKMEFGSIIAIAELHDIRPTTEIGAHHRAAVALTGEVQEVRDDQPEVIEVPVQRCTIFRALENDMP